MATGWRICPPVISNMGMICGAFKRLKNRDKMALDVIPGRRAAMNPESRGSGFALRAPRNDGQRSIRFRPSALNRCRFSRGATALIRSPMAGATAPGIRTITSPGGSSPGLAATP